MRILIVDDNQPVRTRVASILSKRPGLQVCAEAGNAEEALAKTQEFRPDLVLLDISLPGVDGFEVARRLLREMPALAIVFMSQHDPAHVLPRALDAGARACIDKVRLATDLIPTIESLAELSKGN